MRNDKWQRHTSHIYCHITHLATWLKNNISYRQSIMYRGWCKFTLEGSFHLSRPEVLSQYSAPPFTDAMRSSDLNPQWSAELNLIFLFACAQEQRVKLEWQPSLIRLTPLTWRSLWRTWIRLCLRTPDLYSFASFQRSTRQVQCAFYFFLCKTW